MNATGRACHVEVKSRLSCFIRESGIFRRLFLGGPRPVQMICADWAKQLALFAIQNDTNGPKRSPQLIAFVSAIGSLSAALAYCLRGSSCPLADTRMPIKFQPGSVPCVALWTQYGTLRAKQQTMLSRTE